MVVFFVDLFDDVDFLVLFEGFFLDLLITFLVFFTELVINSGEPQFLHSLVPELVAFVVPQLLQIRIFKFLPELIISLLLNQEYFYNSFFVCLS